MMDPELSHLSKQELLRELHRLRQVEKQFHAGMKERDPDRLIHDLQVHQIELEMQNQELRETQRALEQSRGEYADLYDFAPIGYCLLDATSNIRQINLTGAALLGYDRFHLIHRPLTSLRSVCDLDALREHLQMTTQRHTPTSSELRFSGQSGSASTLQLVSTPIRDALGFRGSRTVIMDVTARKQLEARLQLLADVGEWLTLLVDSQRTLAAAARMTVPLMGDVCIIDLIDSDRSIRRIEAAFADVARESKYKTEVMRLAPRPGVDGPQSRVMADGKGMRLNDANDLHAWGTDPEHLRVMQRLSVRSAVVVPLTAHGRNLGALTLLACESRRVYTAEDQAFASELARRIAIAVDNAHLYRRTQQAVYSRERLLAIVSHDLRNPLSAILMMSSHLARLPEKEDRREQTRRAVDRIHQAATSMGRLIGDLLDAASMEAGRFSIHRRDHSADALAREAAEMFQPAANDRSVRLTADTCDPLPLSCDRDRIMQVFGNLIGNALKFTDPGGAVTVRCQRGEKEVLFQVSDTGLGIAPEQLPHLFERFWQQRRKGEIGNGLGLSIAKGIIDAHQGRIWAESTPGQGSTFSFTLPIAQADDAARPRVRAGKQTVLVVDDDDETRASLGAELIDYGFAVATAANGVQALEYLRRSPPPAAILLDLVMPELDGWNLLQARNDDPALRDIPVVVISGQPDVAGAVERANAKYLGKPIRADKLLALLESLLKPE
jgi:PAS domain S-box-containing protein